MSDFELEISQDEFACEDDPRADSGCVFFQECRADCREQWGDEGAVMPPTSYFGKMFAIPWYALQHSGLAFDSAPFACQWDSWFVGYVYVTRKTLRDFGWDMKSETLETDARDYMRKSLHSYCQWLNGEIWQWSIKENDEYVDGCGGYYDRGQCEKDGEEALLNLKAEHAALEHAMTHVEQGEGI